jgi:PAT family beta-lactamase induction signal transducer AmpG
VIAVVVMIEQLIAGAGTAAFTVFILRLCHGEQKASHFAFASSVMSLAATVAGVASGFLYAGLSAPGYFVVAFVASLPGVIAALFVRKI